VFELLGKVTEFLHTGFKLSAFLGVRIKRERQYSV
jgi:hypothetical protein